MNNKLLVPAFFAISTGLASAGVQAALFNFEGSDSGGTGSATMLIDITGNTLTATVHNTSPTTLDNSAGVNTPGITGFGFDLSNPMPNLLTWDFTARDATASIITIGSFNGTSTTGPWIINGTIAGMTLDFLACSSVPNCNAIQGALYNPAATGGFGAGPNFFTETVLTMNFDDTPTLDAFLGNGTCTAGNPCSPFVRFQNVGLNGAGSLRLPGIPDNGSDIPEPGILLLLGVGLAGLGLSRRRQA